MKEKIIAGIVAFLMLFGIGLTISILSNNLNKNNNSYSNSDSKKNDIPKENSGTYSNKNGNSYSRSNSSKSDDELAIKMYVKDVVKGKLKSPSTAKFPSYSEWSVSKSDNTYTVSSYVDAENGFGAEIRTYFSVDVTVKDGMLSYSNFQAY